MSVLLVNKILRLNNVKTRTPVDAKILIIVICVEATIYLLLYNLHGCTFFFLILDGYEHLSMSLQLYLKKRLWHRCFPVNFAKFLRSSFSQNTYGRLHLSFILSWHLLLVSCLQNVQILEEALKFCQLVFTILGEYMR